MSENIYSEFGTKFILLDDSVAVKVGVDEKEGEPAVIKLTIVPGEFSKRVTAKLDQIEALQLIQILAEACQPGVGKKFVNADAIEVGGDPILPPGIQST